MEKAFITVLRLIILFTAYTAITRLLWMWSTYHSTADNFYSMQIGGIIGHVLLLIVLFLCWLMPRKVLNIEHTTFADLPTDMQQLGTKLPQLVVFSIGFYFFLNNASLWGMWLLEQFMTGGDFYLIHFGPQQFWTSVYVLAMIGIPFLIMKYSKRIAHFFIK